METVCQPIRLSEPAEAHSPVEVAELQQILDKVATCQERMMRELATIKSQTNKLDGELDDLAQLYKDDLLFGMGEPQWRRRS